jgi:hypothetical protein
MPTHQEIDQRSLEMHALAVDLMRQDPRRLDHARSTVTRWLSGAQPGLRGYLEDWLRVVEEGIDSVARIATDKGERATALRQSSPITCTLTPRERNKFLRDWKAKHEAK